MTADRKHEITAIEVQARNRSRRNIYLDGEFAFGIHQDVLVDLGIGLGDRLSENDVAKILLAEQAKKAKEKALRLLSVRARSEQEMRGRLYDAGFDDGVAEKTIQDLLRIGLLNDREFALSFARSQMVTRPCGEMLLRRELKRKGVPDEFILLAIEEAYGEKSQNEVAHKLAIKKKRQYRTVEETKAKKRTADFLMRRGFSWHIVSDVLDNWQDLGSEG